MSADGDVVDLDERSFNLESVEIADDDVDVHNELICENRVGVDVKVDIDGNRSNVSNLPPPPVDEKRKNKFEKQRNEILSCVPVEVKARFGEIYFSTFGKFLGPVLIMNPYKVEPGPLRDYWLSMFYNCQKSGRETQMTHLTYWYGQFDDLPNAYSFQKTSQLLSYENGMKRTEKKLKNIQHKHDEGKKLSSKDFNFMKGFEEMAADRTKDPTERYGYVDSNFLEEYHVLLGEEKDEKKEDHQKKQKSKSKNASDSKNGKKKIKKMKGSTQTDKQTTVDLGTRGYVENEETPKTKPKTSKKRSKKGDKSIETLRPKKKIKNVNGDGQDLKTPGKSTTENVERDNGIHRKDDMKGSVRGDDDMKGDIVKKEDRKLSAYKEFAGLGEVSSHGKIDDGSLKMDDLQSDDDSADEDYVEKAKAKASEKKTPRTEAKTQDRPVKSKELSKKVQKTKIKVEDSAVREDKNAAINLNLKKLFKKEQRKFHNCEIEFLPLLRRWEKAISVKNVTQLLRIYEELLTSMEHFTAPFIEEYGMSDLMKRSKGCNNEKHKKVRTKFKTIYKEKKDEVPKGFKAIKESEKYVLVDVKTETAIQEAEHFKAPKLLKDKQNSKEAVGTIDASHTPQDTLVPMIPLSSRKSRNSESSGERTPHVMLEPSPQKHTKPEIKLEPPSLKQNISSMKVERKKRFSLGKLMRAGSSSYQPGNAGTKLISSFDESSVLSSQSSKNNQNTPSWTIQVVSNENYSNENRTFGLEFLQQAALHIPESKTMKYEAVARNIEIAIYDWSTGNLNEKSKNHKEEHQGPWLDKYWNKIHDLAACIGGKRQDGTLAKMIGEGKFVTPNELVCLHDDDLWRSFEGSSLSKI